MVPLMERNVSSSKTARAGSFRVCYHICMCTITVREFCVYCVISCIPRSYACALISMLTVNCTLIHYVYSSICCTMSMAFAGIRYVSYLFAEGLTG